MHDNETVKDTTFKEALEKIAGRNVLNGDNRDISQLAKCCNYLMTQLNIRSRELNEALETESENRNKSVRENATEILTNDKF